MVKLSKVQQRLQGARGAVKKVEEKRVAVDLSDPNLKKVIFMGREIAAGYPYHPEDVVVSITDTHAQPPEFFRKPKEVLHRAFHDHVTAYDEHHYKHRWCLQADGDAIVDFVMRHQDAKTIVVHCNMGQSRSKAAAIVIAQETGRALLYADKDGRVVAYRRDEDDEDYNHRVFSAVYGAFLDYEEAEAAKDVEDAKEAEATGNAMQDMGLR